MQAQAIITLEDQSLLEIKKTWLDYKINQINSSSFGADTIYELQVSRKQDAIECLIEENEAVLTQAEIDEIKHKTEYIENFEPYTELDEETGQLLSIETIAHKMAYWDAC